ncbi:MAG: GNAT family N-acetyltransferase [Chloroflexota bacterium]
MGIEVRASTPEEFSEFLRPVRVAFSWDMTDKERQSFQTMVEFDRTLAAYDASRVVGSAGAYSFQLTLPGPTTVRAAGVTLVAVLPTHRRRGILTSFMRRQLQDIRLREEPVAILYASESTIYGRFGYGPGSTQVEWEIDRRHASFVRSQPDDGELRVIDADEVIALCPAIYDRARRTYPGSVTRTDAWWARRVHEPEPRHDDTGPRFYVLHTSATGEPDGYAVYRLKRAWPAGVPGNVLELIELMPASNAAYGALWNYCFNVDLVATVKAANRPPDEPLQWMLADARRLRVTELCDGLWVRLVDVRAALEARRYRAEGTVILAVNDPFMPHNTGSYRLDGGPEGATCTRTGASPDIVLGVADLGAAYLGNVPVSLLHRAGRVQECAGGALARADAMFASSPAPWCATHF